MNLNLAQEFLTRSFAPGETIALLLRYEEPARVTQRIISIETALAPRSMGWLSHENASGANVYIAANPLRAGSRKRTKESIASVRHLYIDIDTDGDNRLAALRVSDAVPAPTAILSTSPGKYQVLWRVDGFNFETQEATLKKGAHVQVEGELRSREYEPKKAGKKQPEKKTIWEIRVNSILKLDRAAKASKEEQEQEEAPLEEVAA